MSVLNSVNTYSDIAQAPKCNIRLHEVEPSFTVNEKFGPTAMPGEMGT